MQKDIQYKSDRFQRERPSTLKHEITNYLITVNNKHLDSALPMAKTCEGDLMATVHMVFLVMINAVYVQKACWEDREQLSEASPFEAFRSTLQPHL